MTDAAARDERAEPPPSWHPWLLLLLAFTLAPRAIDDVIATFAMGLAAHKPWLLWLPLLSGAIEILGLITAGICVDRYGVRTVAGLSLLAWAAVIASVTLFVRDSPLLYFFHNGAVLIGLFFGLAATVVAKSAVAFTRRARFLAMLELVSVAWLFGVPTIASAAGWPPAPSSTNDWPIGGLVIAAGGGLLAILWWTMRTRDMAEPHGFGRTRTGPSFLEAAALLRRPGMPALVLVMACHLLMFSTLYRVLPLDVVRIRFLPTETFERSLIGPLVVFGVAKMACAVWSDRVARRSGRPASARVPFVVAGAALATTIGLIPFVGNAGLGLILWPLAIGMAPFPLVFTLALDVVPAAMTGRFLGLALAIGMAVTLASFTLASVATTLTHSLSAYFYLAGIAAFVGAVLSWTTLRKLTPPDDPAGFARSIGTVFA